MNLKRTTMWMMLLVCAISAQAQTFNLQKEHAKVLADQLNEWYNDSTGLWETTSWWNGANVLTALIAYGQWSDDDAIKSTVQHTFEKTKRFEVPAQNRKPAWICENYINEYYDDEGWWALAWLDAYEWTGEKRYLDMSVTILNDIVTGWDERCGGGLYWKKGLLYKSSISNGLALTLAARLHLAGVGNVKGRSCQKWAEDIWEWMMYSNLLNENGLMQDGIRTKNNVCEMSSATWTYNQGVVLTGLTCLHKITGNESYLEHAHKLANAAIKHMTNADGILKELNCEPENCTSDSEQFKGVFMRHLGVLNAYSPQKGYKNFLLKNAQSIVENSMRSGKNTAGVTWDRYSEQQNAATTSSALDALNAAASVSGY